MTTDLTTATLQEIGAGITVFEEEGVIEGPALWLGSPEAVIEFVDRDDTDEFIIMARGGTTTFLTPALAAGVKGIVTLQGAPTSHLGIISREYGIPCLMSVAFTAGEINERGETIPPDGTLLRLDVSTSPRGRVLAASDAGLTPTNAAPDDAETAAASTETADAVPTFANGVRGGSEGERIMVSRLKTDVLTLTEESLRRNLAENEVNDLLDFYGWKLWDILAARITEGESGLIPRQQYEVLAVYLQWRTHPRWHRIITDRIGVDGLIEVGAQARRQVGTKINPLHIWAAGLPTALGRGIAVELGIHDADHRREDLAGAMQFTRRLYRGLWGREGPMFTVNRNYTAPVLDDDVIERFIADKTPIEDPAQRRVFQHFNGGTGITSFLLHFDNRCGVADSGPYPIPGGGWMVVRDHVLNDQEYPWSEEVSTLPYAITQVMFFEGGEEIQKSFVDIGTMFTTPANYLRALSGYAVYVKQTEQTPMAKIRLMTQDEMSAMSTEAERASSTLYRRVAAMSEREKILAGTRVYYTDFIAPVAKAAGVWQEMLDNGFQHIDDVVDEVYDVVTSPGKADDLLARHWGAGAGFQHI